MPNVVGLPYGNALTALTSAGVFVPTLLGYFSTFPIAAAWAKSTSPPTTVLVQSPAANSAIAANGSVTLTMAEFPIGVVFP